MAVRPSNTTPAGTAAGTMPTFICLPEATAVDEGGTPHSNHISSTCSVIFPGGLGRKRYTVSMSLMSMT